MKTCISSPFFASCISVYHYGVTALLDESQNIKTDLAQLARLSLSDKGDDIRLFIARLVRKYRDVDPSLSNQLDLMLQTKPSRPRSLLRKDNGPSIMKEALPLDNESQQSLLKVFSKPNELLDPILSIEVRDSLEQLILERKQMKTLLTLGLQATRSAIFVGAPGLGKTYTAGWLSKKLSLPLYVLDLTTVMSSLLGRSGTNLRMVFDFAKSLPCILLLDEIDAVAKRRSDNTDVGELKRLVTIILQEVDQWPSEGLLLAATNHPELIDPALWRRFDLVVNFGLPERGNVKEAVRQYLGGDYNKFELWIDVLVFAFQGSSFSDIERSLNRFRRSVALNRATVPDLIENLIKSRSYELGRVERIEFAVLLSENTRLSQHTIAELTGVSRDTIRRRTNEPAVTLSKKR